MCSKHCGKDLELQAQQTGVAAALWLHWAIDAQVESFQRLAGISVRTLGASHCILLICWTLPQAGRWRSWRIPTWRPSAQSISLTLDRTLLSAAPPGRCMLGSQLHKVHSRCIHVLLTHLAITLCAPNPVSVLCSFVCIAHQSTMAVSILITTSIGATCGRISFVCTVQLTGFACTVALAIQWRHIAWWYSFCQL